MSPDPDRENIAIIAGRGSLPRELFSSVQNTGNEPFLIGIEGEHEDWILDHNHVVLHWGQFGTLFKYLKSNKITKISLAGGVTRPKVNIGKMDWVAIKTLPQILAFMMGGDNSLLIGVIKVFEKHGVKVMGAHEIMPELLTPKGLIAGKKPSRKALANMEKAFEASKRLGELDIGQAAVSIGNRVIAVEGIEGTDGMLSRVAALRTEGKLTEDGKHGVLVKTMKPKQASIIFNQMDPVFAASFLRLMDSNNAGLIMANMESKKAYTISVIMANRNADMRK